MDAFRKYFNIDPSSGPIEAQPDWGINVLSAGHNIHGPRKPYPDPDHPDTYRFKWSEGRVINEYQLVYIADGAGIFEAEDVSSIVIGPGTVFLLFPKVWHRYKPLESRGWEEYWVGFEGPYADHLMGQDCFSPQSSLIQMGFNAEFINIFVRLLETLKFGGLAYRQMSSCLTTHLLGLVYASALLKENSVNRRNQIINNIRYKIHEQAGGHLSPEELAAQHNVSYVWFRKAFKEATGISPGQYLLNLKIEKACRMLRETHLSISAVSFENGFESEHHFSRIFKKKTGLSPSAYKNQTFVQNAFIRKGKFSIK